MKPRKTRSSTEELFESPFFETFVRPLTFALYRLLISTIERLSPRHAYSLARAMGALAWLLSPRLRGVTSRNLELCFGDEMSLARRKEVGKASVQHFLCTLFDVYLLPAFYISGQWQAVISYSEECADQFQALVDCDEGVAFQSAHFGSWEAAAGFGALLGKPFRLVYKPIAHPEIDADFARYRGVLGSQAVPKIGALRTIARTLRDKEWFAILSDQNAGSTAAFLSFFGHAVSSQVEHLQAYRRFNARIATGFAVRQGFDFRFEFVGLWEERFNAEADPVEEAMRLGQWYNDLLEEMVRKYPEQYLWAHRRFASRPAGAPSLYQDLGGPVSKVALDGQPQPPIPPRG